LKRYLTVAIATAVATAGAVAIGSPALPTAQSAATKCHSPNSRTVLENTYARIYIKRGTTERGPDHNIFWGCLFSRGRGYRLDQHGVDGAPDDGFDPAIQGRYAGIDLDYSCAACTYPIRGFRIIDLTDGSVKLERRQGLVGEGDGGLVTDFVFKRNGSAAYLTDREDGNDLLHLVDGDGDRVIDNGVLSGLAMSSDRTRIYWMNGITPKSAAID
jgi:hypothetical protein